MNPYHYAANQAFKSKETSNKKASSEKETSQSDDFTKIKGIGKVTAEKLNEAGITTYAQLADLSEKQLSSLDEVIPSFSANYKSKNWRGQAVLFANEETEK